MSDNISAKEVKPGDVVVVNGRLRIALGCERIKPCEVESPLQRTGVRIYWLCLYPNEKVEFKTFPYYDDAGFKLLCSNEETVP